MKLLKFVECLYRILVLYQEFGLLAKLRFEFVVLLEVQIAQFDIDFHHIVELLLVLLVLFPKLLYFRRRNGTYRFPVSLQFTHTLEVSHGIATVCLRQLLHLIENSLFAKEVLLLLCCHLGGCFGTFLLVLREQLAELHFVLIYRRLPQLRLLLFAFLRSLLSCLTQLLQFLVVLTIELGFQLIHLLFVSGNILL